MSFSLISYDDPIGNNRYVHGAAERWKNTLLQWFGSARRFNYPLLVVRYEDLKQDKVEQVTRMLDFLHQVYNRTELAAKLEAHIDDFHRKHSPDDHYDHFTGAQRAYIISLIEDTMNRLKSMHISSEELKLKEYLE